MPTCCQAWDCKLTHQSLTGHTAQKNMIFIYSVSRARSTWITHQKQRWFCTGGSCMSNREKKPTWHSTAKIMRSLWIRMRPFAHCSILLIHSSTHQRLVVKHMFVHWFCKLSARVWGRKRSQCLNKKTFTVLVCDWWELQATVSCLPTWVDANSCVAS